MDDKVLHDFALFKFSLIAPAVNDSFSAPSRAQFFRDMADMSHTLPDGSSARFAASTIRHWFEDYRRYGFDILIPKSRCDLGSPRCISQDATKKIHSLKEQFPYITGKLVYQKLVEEGYIKVSSTSLASVLRYIRANNLKRNQVAPVDRRAFEMEFANDCWQSDTSHGPVIKVDGVKRQTFLITFIDDASRLILHGEFFFNDNAVNMQAVFKRAVAKYGVPKRLFLDNGKSFKNEQIGLICASLGTVLIYAKPYSPESKGKIERSFRTIKDNWINGVDWNGFSSLDDLNSGFAVYLSDKYTNVLHSAIGTAPRDRFMKDYDRVRFIPAEILDNHFLHRVTRKVNMDATISLSNIFFELPQKYIGQKVNVRFLPSDLSRAFVFSHENVLVDTVFPLKRVDNSKVRRNVIDYSKVSGGAGDV